MLGRERVQQTAVKAIAVVIIAWFVYGIVQHALSVYDNQTRQIPTDHYTWEYLTQCAGDGNSMEVCVKSLTYYLR